MLEIEGGDQGCFGKASRYGEEVQGADEEVGGRSHVDQIEGNRCSHKKEGESHQ